MSFAEKDNRPGRDNSRLLGTCGEELAARYLEKLGYRLVIANFKAPIGRNANEAQITGEIDLIALDGETLCFIEVKTRASDEFASPLSAVDLRKQRQIIRAARVYRRTFGISGTKYRYDVITVLERGVGPAEMEVFKSYWNEQKFRKRSWSGDIWEEG